MAISIRPEELPFVSVIVPVYNGEKTIEKCITSLLNLDYPEEKLEIIIADNNSKDRTRKIVSRFPVTLLEEKEIQSSYAARNKGIRHAKGEVLAFTDADMYVDKAWLRKAIEAMKDKEADMVAGYVEPVAMHTPPLICEVYDRMLQRGCNKPGASGTDNLVTKSFVFEKIGPFRNDLQSGGDVEWVNRAKSYNFKLIFCEKAIIYHITRSSFKSLIKKGFRIGRGDAHLRGKEVFDINFIKAFFPGFRTFWRNCRRENCFNLRIYLGLILASISFSWAHNIGRVKGVLERKNPKRFLIE